MWSAFPADNQDDWEPSTSAGPGGMRHSHPLRTFDPALCVFRTLCDRAKTPEGPLACETRSSERPPVQPSVRPNLVDRTKFQAEQADGLASLAHSISPSSARA